MLRPLTKTLGVLLLLSAAWMPASGFAASGEPLNRVANGGFESGFLSLSLPSVSRFPMVVNGWAARGTPIPRVSADPRVAFEGVHALRLASAPRSPVQVLQDLPLSSTSYRLALAFQPQSGSQVVRLLSSWDRGDPGGGVVAVAVALAPTGIEVVTSAGAWSMEHDLVAGQWHWLEVVSDARTGVQTVTLDGAASMSLPGIPSDPPQTLLIGDLGGADSSSYLYDSIWLAQLPEAELAALRSEVSAAGTLSQTPGLASRLDAAATALRRGSTILALSELEAARRLLGGTAVQEAARAAGDEEATGRALLALAALIDLLRA
jgi:hypothetical protein